MNLRQLCFKAMLWSLAAAAAFGALGMLVADVDSVWRVSLTAFLTAVAAGLLWPIAILVDRQTTRSAGLFGMAGVILTLLLFLPAVWSLTSFDEGIFAASGATIFWTTPVAMMGAYMLSKQISRYTGYAILVTCGLFTILCLSSIWSYELSGGIDFANKLGLSSVATAGLGVTLAICLVGVTTDRQHFRFVGVAFAVIAWLWACYLIWGDVRNEGKLMTLFASMAVVFAHTNVMGLVPLEGQQKYLRYATIILAWITTALLNMLVIYQIDDFDSLFMRAMGAAAIATSAGTLAMIVLARLNRRVEFELVESQFLNVNITCPRCRKKQNINLGDSHCKHCNLRISIRVEEPRCPQCGYLLYMLTSDNCPECGAAIEAPQQT